MRLAPLLAMFLAISAQAAPVERRDHTIAASGLSVAFPDSKQKDRHFVLPFPQSFARVQP